MEITREDVLKYLAQKLEKTKCDLKIAKVRHDNAALLDIERKIEIYRWIIKALKEDWKWIN